MPVKRRTSKVRDVRITREAVEAYRMGRGGELHELLGLRPWHCSPLWPVRSRWSADPMIVELRRQLEAALAEAERTPRRAGGRRDGRQEYHDKG